jgi:hypothetical protein
MRASAKAHPFVLAGYRLSQAFPPSETYGFIRRPVILNSDS